MSTFKQLALKSLQSKAETDKQMALASLEIMLEHPAGIGDHSTEDLHNNLNEALSNLADADDRLDALQEYFS
ncbi:MAG: hypothetical protein ABGY11_15015 [Candidatus Thioglobus sp.]|jgi:hypothetical protein